MEDIVMIDAEADTTAGIKRKRCLEDDLFEASKRTKISSECRFSHQRGIFGANSAVILEDNTLEEAGIQDTVMVDISTEDTIDEDTVMADVTDVTIEDTVMVDAAIVDTDMADVTIEDAAVDDTGFSLQRDSFYPNAAEIFEHIINNWSRGKNIVDLLSTFHLIIPYWLPVSQVNLANAAHLKSVFWNAVSLTYLDKVKLRGSVRDVSVAAILFPILKKAWAEVGHLT